MKRGFTLIELLVVVTIIVVLLALLTPALDKAIYQADLLRCAANCKGMGTGVLMYTVDFKRAYPWRPYAMNVAGSPKRISSSGAVNDTRRLMRPYISIKGHLLCPFTPAKVDYDASQSGSIVEVSYSMFFGVQYKNSRTGNLEKGMLHRGDRLEFDGDSFDTLAADFDEITPDTDYTSHLDRDETGQPQFVQDAPPGGAGNNYTLTRWAYPSPRTPIDTQYVLDDASVGFIKAVTRDENMSETGRVAHVPLYCNDQTPADWLNIPKR